MGLGWTWYTWFHHVSTIFRIRDSNRMLIPKESPLFAANKPAAAQDHVPAEDCRELPSDALPDGEAVPGYSGEWRQR